MSNVSQTPACLLPLSYYLESPPASPPVWAPTKPLLYAKTKLVQETRFSTIFNHWFCSLVEFGAKL